MIWYAFLILGIGLVVYNCAKLALVFIDNAAEEFSPDDREKQEKNEQQMNPIMVDLEYPRIEENPDRIQINLIDIRAADSIRIGYDFERDGWIIEQASKFSWPIGDKTGPDWQEVAFVKAWGREKNTSDE